MLMRDLLKENTARDNQKLIGPSLIGSPCDACIVEGLSGKPEPKGRYWLGGVIGTAIHSYLEQRTEDFMGEYTVREQKVTIYNLKGYGMISGSPDLVVLANSGKYYPTDSPVLIDWKTTGKEKLPLLKLAWSTEASERDNRMLMSARFNVEAYQGQLALYAYGLNKMGIPISKASIQWVARGGSGDSDFFEVDFDYDPTEAKRLLRRLRDLYRQYKADPLTEFDRHPHCYTHGGK